MGSNEACDANVSPSLQRFGSFNARPRVQRMLPIAQSLLAYEKWLRRRLVLIPADLRHKREKMRRSPFAFLRGSFFRWVEAWPHTCREIADAPRVLSVADIHVENFGTWRDADGRLAWGVNDFDEAETLPYTNDLVRLCTSVILAIEDSSTGTSVRSACQSVLDGYRHSLAIGGKPIVPGKQNRWLKTLAEHRAADDAAFWKPFLALKRANAPASLRPILMRALPKPHTEPRIVHRSVGLGSLGRQRFAALASGSGGPVAREAKALTVSAVHWLDHRANATVRYRQLVRSAIRAPDPSLSVRQGWVVRRLAPDCRKIEFHELPQHTNLQPLLEAMGHELANVHLGTPRQRAAIRRDLDRRKPRWLQHASERMAEITMQDWKVWK